ncbi:unnamed protein product [Acanthoscelides obtectus]|uniref:Uncharacterized protein n=1 Tax=Acanthoscelides obtectus TaxID=200917 RepID=A0A9P0JQL6_ACAOB|nr:unnamed protein product [Acanthoscelides obtectus]CAK1655018.1 hypothetical protein AOBTE_LOCUS18967 [Acanthoscelides obtectus]
MLKGYQIRCPNGVCPPPPSPSRHRELDDGAEEAVHTFTLHYLAACPPHIRHPSAVIPAAEIASRSA